MKIFISYTHKDEEYKDSLLSHLALLKRQGLISAWHDSMIDAGQDLDSEININLASSNIFIALISSDYINSDYCYNNELKTALQYNNNNQLKIIPLIVRPCDWHSSPFGKLKALPKDGKAISTYENKDTAYLHVIESIRSIIKKNP